MCDTLAFTDDEIKLIEYLQNQELTNTFKFVYLACRQGSFTEDEEANEYDHTWLAKHHLTVVEEVNEKTAEVKDQTGSGTDVQSGTHEIVKKQKLFNSYSGNVENKSWSLYSQYRKLFGIDYYDKTKNVLLLYITPTETEDSLRKLQNDARGNSNSINQNVHVGVLKDSASFYSVMVQFMDEK